MLSAWPMCSTYTFSPINDWLLLTTLCDGALCSYPFHIPGSWHLERLGDWSRITEPGGIRAALNPGSQHSSPLRYASGSILHKIDLRWVFAYWWSNAVRDSRYPVGWTRQPFPLTHILPLKTSETFFTLSSTFHCYLYLLILSLPLWGKMLLTFSSRLIMQSLGNKVLHGPLCLCSSLSKVGGRILNRVIMVFYRKMVFIKAWWCHEQCEQLGEGFMVQLTFWLDFKICRNLQVKK